MLAPGQETAGEKVVVTDLVANYPSAVVVAVVLVVVVDVGLPCLPC